MITHTYTLEDDAADRIPQSWGSPHTQQQQHSPGGVQRQRTADPPYTAHRDRTAQRTATEQHSTAKTEQHSTAEAEQRRIADSRDGTAQQQRSAYAVTQSDLAIL